MTEREKMGQRMLYDANYDQELLAERARCKDLCFLYNQIKPSLAAEQENIIRQLFGKTGKQFCITAPFWCDYGCNIEIGENFYTNHNCVILDGAKVIFGDNVFIAPNCIFPQQGTLLTPISATRGWSTPIPLRWGTMFGSARR